MLEITTRQETLNRNGGKLSVLSYSFNLQATVGKLLTGALDFLCLDYFGSSFKMLNLPRLRLGRKIVNKTEEMFI